MRHLRLLILATIAALLVVMLPTPSQAAKVPPKSTNYDLLARAYHCGDYFHDWKDWQKHVRGFILYRDGSPIVYRHVAGTMSDYFRYDHLIVSLCAK